MGLFNSFLKTVWNGVFNITGMDISFDIEFSDFSFYLIELKANYKTLKTRFEHMGIVPVETSPNETRLQVNTLDMRKVQLIEPYHEVSIHIPVESIEERTNATFVHLYLPVTSEEARWGGVDVNGFPKFIAPISIKHKESVIECSLHTDEGLVLDYSVENHQGSHKQIGWDLYGVRNNQLLRTSFNFQGNIYETDNLESSVHIGEQKMAKELQHFLVSDKIERVITAQELSGILKKPIFIKNLWHY